MLQHAYSTLSLYSNLFEKKRRESEASDAMTEIEDVDDDTRSTTSEVSRASGGEEYFSADEDEEGETRARAEQPSTTSTEEVPDATEPVLTVTGIPRVSIEVPVSMTTAPDVASREMSEIAQQQVVDEAMEDIYATAMTRVLAGQVRCRRNRADVLGGEVSPSLLL